MHELTLKLVDVLYPTTVTLVHKAQHNNDTASNYAYIQLASHALNCYRNQMNGNYSRKLVLFLTTNLHFCNHDIASLLNGDYLRHKLPI